MDGVVLQPRSAELLAEERTLLGDVREALVIAEAPPDGLAVLRRAIADLDQLFLLVVVGEFNAGKSAFVNALLGGSVLEEGVTPTTAMVTVVSFGEERARRIGEGGVVEIADPAPILRQIKIVDTPGTNAVLREHERLTREFMPRSDLVLFVTSADRPFTESERAFLEAISAWGKKIVLVLNKADLLRNSEDLATQRQFILTGAARLLGFTPELFAVSALRAREAQSAATAEERERLRAASGFDELVAFLRATLDDVGRVRLKLLTPLGVAARLGAEQRQAATSRLEVLRGDMVAGERIERQLQLYRDDMRRDLEPRLGELENVVRAMGERGQAFFDETLRIGRVFDLFNTERIRGEFEREVVGDAPAQIDRLAQDLIDWMVDQDLRLWRSVADQVEQRRRDASDASPAGLAGSFEYDRRALLQTVGRVARDVLQRHDHRQEAQELASSVRDAVTRATLVEAGAVSLGAVTMAVVGSAAADVTGLLAAGVLAGVGFYILPLKKRRAAEQFRARTEELRERLTSALRSEFERELDGSLQRIRDALAPYDRFVRAEQERIGRGERELAELEDRLSRLRARVDALDGQRTARPSEREASGPSESDEPGTISTLDSR